ncbi:PAS domain S-box/diguanylate cyclase (GGDEF) domain [endosymbiont of Ridgeia piscesae]|jgi:diguanylate cyclase (GGDEF)-like protein/PAS domain S-box-containing protein|uniref:diguanylate cyclase n=5 Tax=endosymbiont of Ridgeia piscesae TaxID=54398 RepID=A0A0T5YTQ3_9GAMM|nr:PAS domain S-box/diguanylate cyclase (GGDEF) domain [endosymbiont of Ridgeia piscesae]
MQPNHRLTHHLLLILLGLMLLASLIHWGLRAQVQERVEQKLHDQSVTLLRQLNQQLQTDLKEIRSDLLYLTDQARQNGLAQPQPSAQAIARTGIAFKVFSRYKRRYDQVRFLDAEGMERVRVNANQGQPTIVPADQLQSKAHRYYFTETIGLPSGAIYTSPFDLNVEHGEVELPLKPMLRLASPVSDAQSNKRGIVILNYLGRHLLNDFLALTRDYPGRTYLLNSEGRYLLSPNKLQEWNFMFPDLPQVGFAQDHPLIWSQITQRGIASSRTAEGRFVHLRMRLPNSQSSLSSSYQNCEFVLILQIPEALLETQIDQEMARQYPLLGLFFLILGAVLIFLTFNREKRRLSELQIQHLNQEIADERDLFIGGPTVVIHWRNEFGWPIDYISSNVEPLLGYTAEEFQSGELSLSSIVAPSYLQQLIQENETAQTDSRSWFERKPYQLVSADGRRLWIQDTTSVIRDSAGHITHFYAYISDISPLKQAEEKLQRSHHYIQNVVDTIADPTLVINIDTYRLEIANSAARQTYCGGASIDAEMTCHRLSHKREVPCSGEHDPCPIELIRKTKAPARVIHKHFDSHGKVIYAEVSATPIFDDTGERVVQIIESHRDITHHVEMEQQLTQLAATDRLTQVFNRMKFDDELVEQIEWAKQQQSALGLIMFDIDHFKRINDNHGHDIGDRVLQEAVAVVQKRIRKSDMLARWGGEEFMIITPLADLAVVETVAEDLRKAIAQHQFPQVGRITASFGASMLHPDDDARALIKRVDQALYRSKREGRNRTTVSP